MADPAGAVTLATLQAQGLHLSDPVRWRFYEALARRAAAHGGETRRLLDARLASLLARHAERLASPRPGVECAGPDATAAGAPPGSAESAQPLPPVAPGPLADLLLHIQRQAVDDGAGVTTEAPLGCVPTATPPTELKALSQFRHTWSRLSVDQQLNRSLAKLPDNAGPLNSHRLVLRALKLMNEVSPDHLQRYMSYVDALLWLDQANPVPSAAPGPASRPERDRKRRPAGRGRPG